MENLRILQRKWTDRDDSGLEIRFFTGPDSDLPETELEKCRIPVRLEALIGGGPGEPSLVRVLTAGWASVPTPGARADLVARYLDVAVDGRQVSRTDLRFIPDTVPGELVINEGQRFTLEISPQ